MVDFGSAGHGNLTHLAGELFKLRTGIDMIHVPYKSAAEAATGILGGQVYCGFGNLNVMLPHIRAGSFRALAVTRCGVASGEHDPVGVELQVEHVIER